MAGNTTSRLDAVKFSLIFTVFCLLAIPANTFAAQFEIIGASDAWIALWENVPPTPDALDSCAYGALEAGAAIGVKIHFVRVSPEMKRGILSSVGPFDSSFTFYEPAKNRGGCTSAEMATKNWNDIEVFANQQGVRVSKAPKVRSLFGSPIPANACTLFDKLKSTQNASKTCNHVQETTIDGQRLTVAWSLVSIPEAAEESKCQFIGHRFGAALQVKWLNSDAFGSRAVPGGLIAHFDCRPQLFMPIRLYVFEERIVLMASFKGDNIADHNEYPSILALSRQASK
jgi:hypothetical protein